MTPPVADPDPTSHPTSGLHADLAAARARHPAGRHRPGHQGPALSFAGAVALLTGPWRVSDPDGFAGAMVSAPVVAGHLVADLAVAAPDGLVAALAAAARRSRLALWWVAGAAGGRLHVEARAHAANGPEGPELFVLAHLEEALGGGRSLPGDHSWIVVVAGDGSGGVAGVARAMLACPRRPRCCPAPEPAVRFALAGLRARLMSPALEAEGASCVRPATVLSFPARA